MSVILDITMPKGCVHCPLCEGCKEPKNFPIIKCMIIGEIGSMFNFDKGRPVDCPLHEKVENNGIQ